MHFLRRRTQRSDAQDARGGAALRVAPDSQRAAVARPRLPNSGMAAWRCRNASCSSVRLIGESGRDARLLNPRRCDFLPGMGPLVYRIDAFDRIVAVNDAWDFFAKANGGWVLRRPEIYGRLLLDFVSDDAVRAIYAAIIKEARANRPVCFEYRCDAPEWRREFRLQVTGMPSQDVEFVSTVLREERRVALPIFSAPKSPRGFVRMCSWCHAVALDPGSWVALETVLADPRLFETNQSVSHGICPICADKMMSMLKPLAGARSQS